MEPNNNYNHSNLESIVEGAKNGFKMTIDPVGLIYSSVTNTKTMGGRGLYDVDMDGNKKENITYDSIFYLGPKVVGMMGGVVIQVEALFIPLLYFSYRNIKHYQENKIKGTEKFEFMD